MPDHVDSPPDPLDSPPSPLDSPPRRVRAAAIQLEGVPGRVDLTL